MNDIKWFEKLGKNPLRIDFVPEHFKNDAEIFKKIVSFEKSGRLIRFASLDVRNNLQVALMAVVKDTQAFNYIPKNLKNSELFLCVCALYSKESNGLYYRKLEDLYGDYHKQPDIKTYTSNRLKELITIYNHEKVVEEILETTTEIPQHEAITSINNMFEATESEVIENYVKDVVHKDFYKDISKMTSFLLLDERNFLKQYPDVTQGEYDITRCTCAYHNVSTVASYIKERGITMTDINNLPKTYGVDFFTDVDKIHDFFTLSQKEFLSSYSYINELDYIATQDMCNKYDINSFSQWGIFCCTNEVTPNTNWWDLKGYYCADKEFIKAAIEHQGAFYYESADEKVRFDKDVTLVAVKQNYEALRVTSKVMKADIDVVRAAVTADGRALEFADKSFRSNEEIVKLAVSSHGFALYYTDKSMDCVIDKELALKAIATYPYSFRYMDSELANDLDVLGLAVQLDANMLQHIDKELITVEFLMENVNNWEDAWQSINPAIMYDIQKAYNEHFLNLENDNSFDFEM